MNIKPDPSLPWPVDYEDGVLPIAQDEGCKLKAYLCPAGKWTAGFGETEGVGPTTVFTQAYADQRFCDSLTYRVQTIRAACKIEPTEHQLAALLSFAYNYGKWRTSTVMKCHNAGDFLGAARAFDLVNQYTDPKTGKRVVSPGLTARRKREAALYLRPADGAMAMPQIVQPESNLAKSPIATSGAIAVGGGLISIAGEVNQHVGVVGTALTSTKSVIVETLGVPSAAFLPVVLVIFGGVAVYYRWRQRKSGWA